MWRSGWGGADMICHLNQNNKRYLVAVWQYCNFSLQ
uniref:Uncharacterized protein n=1 Tax=Zea mays TaxID=4577 RepID=B4FM08_MAIZE|nr:unknown [Zea mays]